MSSPSPDAVTAAPAAGLSGAQRALLEKRLLAARRAQGPDQVIPPAITRRGQRDHIPLSDAQERLWFLDQVLPDRSLYNLFEAVRIHGPLDADIVERTLVELIRRHDVFRTTFASGDDGPFQAVSENWAFRLDRADLSALPEPERESSLDSLLRQEAGRPFDLTSDLLLRALLVRMRDGEHVLLFSMHHIVSDGWTLGLLLREFAVIYDALARGATPDLPELPVRFADYAAWERETVRGQALEEPLAYWRRQLSGAEALELPTDHPRPADPTFRGSTERLVLPPPLVASIRALGNREGATLFTTLLAGFQALLHRYTRQEDIVVGSCVAGRPQVELEPLAGFFVNTIVLRTSAGGRPSFREMLLRTRQTVFDAMANHRLPFEKIVAELQPDRSPIRNPFFQVMIVLQSASGGPPAASGLRFEHVEVGNGTSKFDMTLSIADDGAGNLHLSLEYRSELFERATVARFLGHYRTLLSAAVADPSLPLDELPLLSAAERSLLASWSSAPAPYPRERSTVDIFQAQADASPDAGAVSDGTTSLTYRELDRLSNRLARHLVRRGAVAGAPIAFSLERSSRIAVTALAILKARGAYLSLDPAYPGARLALMLSDSRPPVVVVERALRPAIEASFSCLPAESRPVLVCLDDEADAIASEPASPLDDAPAPGDTAYICYTSGSTGLPKGVCVPHRAIVRLVCNTNFARFGPDETFLQFAPVAFDASTLELWAPLLNGGRLVVFPPGLPSLSELGDFIRTRGITTLFLTTGLFHQMIDEQARSLAGIRQLMVGGEALSPPHAARARRELPRTRLINGYGPTENTCFSTTHLVSEEPLPGETVPIGRPIANSTAWILDGRMQPVPIGVPGELYVGGDGVASGYLGRPDLTSEKFVPDPFAPGCRLYRTGDLARWRSDGAIEFLGRTDRQVKLRGFRIEPGEIEAVLASHPSVSQAAVVVDSAGADARLVAFVSPRGSAKIDPAVLRRHAADALPDFMVPVAVVPLDTIPLNANGKVDRAALPIAIRPDARAGGVAPRNPVEQRLAAIVAEILGVASVGAHDNFFQLGGHSMTGVRLFARIERDFGRRLPLASLFAGPTVAELAERLGLPRADTTCTSLVALQPKGTRPPLFLMHGAGRGNLWTYTNLVPHLGSDQPVYALESRVMRDLPEFETIEEMAAGYVTEIRAIQERGPYYLGGYCFGGTVAYEMARQLDAAGERVALLALLDTSAPNSTYQQLPWWRPSFHLRFAANTAYWLKDFADQPLRDQVRYVQRKSRLFAERLVATFRGSRQELRVEEVVDVNIIPEIELGLWKIHLRSLAAYRPGPYPGRVTLFRTRGQPFLCSFDPLFGWGPLAKGGVRVVRLPGAHEKIFLDPHVREFSALLRRELELTQEQEKQGQRLS